MALTENWMKRRKKRRPMSLGFETVTRAAAERDAAMVQNLRVLTLLRLSAMTPAIGARIREGRKRTRMTEESANPFCWKAKCSMRPRTAT